MSKSKRGNPNWKDANGNGVSGNAAGRTKGSINRSTKEMRELIKSIIDNNLDKLQSDLESMSPNNRVQNMERLIKYFMPSLTKTEIDANITGDLKVNFNISEEE